MEVVTKMESLEKHKTIVVEHEIVVDGVTHKERKEITTVTMLCESCHPYDADKCPCEDSKGIIKTIKRHECRIGSKFYEVCEITSNQDDEVTSDF